jgi:hypothetical protein
METLCDVHGTSGRGQLSCVLCGRMSRGGSWWGIMGTEKFEDGIKFKYLKTVSAKSTVI